MVQLQMEYLEDRTTPSEKNLTPIGLTPAEVRHAYGFDQIPDLVGHYNTAGSGQTIAIVMAGHDPNITSDLGVFSQTFGLPQATFVQLNQNGSTTGPWPRVNAQWAGEMAMEVEWAHAIAPGAKIVLVEANSARLNDLVKAIDTARHYEGVSAVSMSWGLLQGQGMDAYEKYFTTPADHTPITFVAATLDNGLVFPDSLYWPSVSPRVIAVGGTSLTFDPDGNYQNETAWGPSTGGISTWFAQPDYQKGIVPQPTQGRAVPDVSYHADNSNEGFAVYTTVRINGRAGWFNAGGDSAGAPQWAALVAIANQERVANGLETLDGFSQTLPGLYDLARANYSAYYNDITSGSNGNYSAEVGYDLVTGLGTPKAGALVPALAAVTTSAATFPLPPTTESSFGSARFVHENLAEDITIPLFVSLPPEQLHTRPRHASVAEITDAPQPTIFLPPSASKALPWSGDDAEGWWN